MKINRQLNLVVPLYGDDGKTPRAYVHSTPISSEVYAAHWRVLSRTFSDIITSGLMPVGARVAARMLEDVARELGQWETQDGAKLALLPEIHRLTNVLVPGAPGWDLMPLDDATKTGAVDADDAAEVEGILVFFTAGSHLFMRTNRAEMLTGAIGSWGARIESSTCTELLTFLRTSTPAANTGATAVR